MLNSPAHPFCDIQCHSIIEIALYAKLKTTNQKAFAQVYTYYIILIHHLTNLKVPKASKCCPKGLINQTFVEILQYKAE